MTNNSGNKKIVKNTLFMYFRMLLLLVISLYSSRLILQILGIDNYGIYNVVGGIVVLFSFVNSGLAIGIQRHLSIELGKKEGNISRILSACINIQILIGGVILILAETIGLWFLNTKMNFPEGRLWVANIVYQFSVLTCISNIIQAPLNATVIAYEKMSFYAYLGIIEGIIKLLIVCLLLVIPGDHLMVFSLLQFVLSFCITISYLLFIVFRLHIKYSYVRDRGLYKFILSFSGWTLFGSLANLLESQGLNILLNIFGGVAINAAVGIANQVRGSLTQFVNGFQQALNPQLVMAHSSGTKDRQFDLICKSSKYSYFILFALALPVCIELDPLLHIWLTVVPDYTTKICILAIIVQLIECFSSPLYTTIFAIGNIRKYQIFVCLLKSSSIIWGYLICYFNFDFYLVFLSPCFIAFFLLWYRLVYVRREICFPIRQYFVEVLHPILWVTIISLIPIYVLNIIFPHTSNFYILFIKCLIYCVLIGLSIFFFGMKKNERNMVFDAFLNKVKNVK